MGSATKSDNNNSGSSDKGRGHKRKSTGSKSNNNEGSHSDRRGNVQGQVVCRRRQWPEQSGQGQQKGQGRHLPPCSVVLLLGPLKKPELLEL